jgi:cysteinyl-tRNA synthetase
MKLCQFWETVIGTIPFRPDSELLHQFKDALDDDLNISKAWGVVHSWIRELNRSLAQGKLSAEQAATAVGTWKELDKVFGLNLKVKTPFQIRKAPAGIVPSGELFTVSGELTVPQEVRDLLKQRDLARKQRAYKLADHYRDQIKALGYLVEDTHGGQQVKELQPRPET